MHILSNIFIIATLDCNVHWDIVNDCAIIMFVVNLCMQLILLLVVLLLLFSLSPLCVYLWCYWGILALGKLMVLTLRCAHYRASGNNARPLLPMHYNIQSMNSLFLWVSFSTTATIFPTFWERCMNSLFLPKETSFLIKIENCWEQNVQQQCTW